MYHFWQSRSNYGHFSIVTQLIRTDTAYRVVSIKKRFMNTKIMLLKTRRETVPFLRHEVFANSKK